MARQAAKIDLLQIGEALGLKVSKRETSLALADRVLAAAHQLRRDHDIMAKRCAEYERTVGRRG